MSSNKSRKTGRLLLTTANPANPLIPLIQCRGAGVGFVRPGKLGAGYRTGGFGAVLAVAGKAPDNFDAWNVVPAFLSRQGHQMMHGV
jgi:hypothetical protein